MANASRKHMGQGSQGKGDGSGAMTDVQKQMIEDDMPLSNRDKAAHSEQRGLDSRGVMNDQLQDHEHNQYKEDK